MVRLRDIREPRVSANSWQKRECAGDSQKAEDERASRDARSLGLTTTDPFVIACLAHKGELERFLRQGPEPSPPTETLTELLRLADMLR